MKKTWRDAEALLAEIRKHMLGTVKGFSNSVKVIDQDGSVLFYENAFTREWEDFILVFTEHHGYHAYHVDDATVYEYENVSTIKLTDDEVMEWKEDFALYETDHDAWWERHTQRSGQGEEKDI